MKGLISEPGSFAVLLVCDGGEVSLKLDRRSRAASLPQVDPVLAAGGLLAASQNLPLR